MSDKIEVDRAMLERWEYNLKQYPLAEFVRDCLCKDIAKLLESPNCEAIVFAYTGGIYARPNEPDRPVLLHCVLPKGHHTSSNGCCYDRAARPELHVGDVHQIEPSLWNDPKK